MSRDLNDLLVLIDSLLVLAILDIDNWLLLIINIRTSCVYCEADSITVVITIILILISHAIASITINAIVVTITTSVP